MCTYRYSLARKGICLKNYCAAAPAIQDYISRKEPHLHTSEENHVLKLLVENLELAKSVYSLLVILGQLSVKMKHRFVDICTAQQLISKAKAQLIALQDLSATVMMLRKDLIEKLGKGYRLQSLRGQDFEPFNTLPKWFAESSKYQPSSYPN